MKTGLQKSNRKLILTRIETWATPGVPDLLVCDEKGNFHFIELKTTSTNSVRLSAHQVAWFTTHSNSSSWIFVYSKNTIYIYKPRQAIFLFEKGLNFPPFAKFEKPFSWDNIFNLITPIQSDIK